MQRASHVLELSVNASRGVGPFCIGLPLNAVIALLTHEYDLYTQVDLVYNEDDPLLNDIVLRMAAQGLQLRFHPSTQQLRAVEVIDPRALVLKYGETTFSMPGASSTFESIYHTFGPTHGHYDHEKHGFVLTYPGLVLVFNVRDGKGVDLIKEIKSSHAQHATLSNLIVFHGDNFESPKAPPLEVTRELRPPAPLDTLPLSSLTPLYLQPHYLERVEILTGGPKVGLFLTHQQAHLLLGDACEHVVGLLGPPVEVYFKEEDKMSIHKAQVADVSRGGADFFYNYFHLGFDVLFDALTLCVKKLVLHTNFPGHYDFSRYSRCNFSLTLHNPFRGQAQALPQQGSGNVQRARAKYPAMNVSVIAEQPGALESAESHIMGLRESSNFTAEDLHTAESEDLTEVDLSEQEHVEHTGHTLDLNPDVKWKDVQAFLGSSCGKPVVFSRPSAPNAQNPFGSTVFYALEGCVFEVLGNEHIASVTIHQD